MEHLFSSLFATCQLEQGFGLRLRQVYYNSSCCPGPGVEEDWCWSMIAVPVHVHSADPVLLAT